MEDRKEQFSALFEKHSDELFRHALLRLSDRERALEITQESFLKAWAYVSSGKDVLQWRSFLYRILNNLIVDEYRKHKTQSLDALLSDEETATAIEGELLRDDTDIVEEAIVRFDGARALRALEQLSEAYRTVLLMRYIDGLSPREIAESLGESENTVSVRIHRGIKKLQVLLQEERV
jgi:RNA polymerase sigma-70 factor (ECF subfamily)